MQEQRQLARFDVSLPATVTFEERPSVSTRVRDISAMGAFIYLEDCDAKIGESVELLLHMTSTEFPWLPQDKTSIDMVATGRLVRTEEEGMAVMFTHRMTFTPVD